jgi:hypothetical protein
VVFACAYFCCRSIKEGKEEARIGEAGVIPQQVADTPYNWQLQVPFPLLGRVFINLPHNSYTSRTWKPTIHCDHAVHSG